MNTAFSFIQDYYIKELVKQISVKYALPPSAALRKFLFSKTYGMLKNPELEMWDFSPVGIFDMWENEQISGDPRNSVYIRGE